jgi:hypothetical protein
MQNTNICFVESALPVRPISLLVGIRQLAAIFRGTIDFVSKITVSESTLYEKVCAIKDTDRQTDRQHTKKHFSVIGEGGA